MENIKEADIHKGAGDNKNHRETRKNECGSIASQLIERFSVGNESLM